jgi:alpha-D-ribose 1-methylphosphonate 5-triphosphate diphosphatase
MSTQTIFANATLILPTEVVRGSLQITDGIITDIDTGVGVPHGAIDLQGDYLSAGLVELHTDNLERHLAPRPKVNWPYGAAILAHDRELSGTGITTVFDAIRVGSIVTTATSRSGKYARQMADEILAMQSSGHLRISHHIHLRAEICSETLIEEFAEFSIEDRVGIVSMMDHTPGQRQFTDLAKFEAYVRSKHRFTDQEFRDYIVFLTKLQARVGTDHEAAVVGAANRLGATLASHDDTTQRQVDTSHNYGVTIAEFPTTRQAADACHSHGIATMVGAPNLIRGGSHFGNIAAVELAQLGRLDILSSDYVPAGLLMAAHKLGEIWGDMAHGMATVTHHPASAVGLTDRGQLQAGLRGDVIRFSIHAGIPVLHETWHAGRRVF